MTSAGSERSRMSPVPAAAAGAGGRRGLRQQLPPGPPAAVTGWLARTSRSWTSAGPSGLRGPRCHLAHRWAGAAERTLPEREVRQRLQMGLGWMRNLQATGRAAWGWGGGHALCQAGGAAGQDPAGWESEMPRCGQRGSARPRARGPAEHQGQAGGCQLPPVEESEDLSLGDALDSSHSYSVRKTPPTSRSRVSSATQL